MNGILEKRLDKENHKKLAALKNPGIEQLIANYVEHCNPKSIFICTDSKKDVDYIRGRALEAGEEKKLAINGYTIHYDGIYDQGRDKEVTKYLLPEGVDLGDLNSIGKKEGLEEMQALLKDSMKGKEMLVLFFTLGPKNSGFSISCLQITDSYYVGHSEHILYRTGYEEFKNLGGKEFFRFVHSAGEIENRVSKNHQKKRIYIDLKEDIIYSVNTQYAGNTVGLKKLALRLAIQKASREGWLAEHMLIMGVQGPEGRVTYFTGAFPSACGKTSTAMVHGETIVGDDLAYLKKINGRIKVVNVEKGIFGIIKDVNARDDPVIWGALTIPGEVIFSNVLVDETNNPRWLGDKRIPPEKGVNFSGGWHQGKKDKDGKDIPYAHPNARYTIELSRLKNKDRMLDDPNGIEISGVVYGGRDSDTTVPVEQSFDWVHGIVTKGATLESETTAATLGKEGVRAFNPMSNLDFVSIPLGRYIGNNLNFAKGIKNPPIIFSVNYFLKGEDGNYLNGMEDKRVWLKWMDLRVHNEADAIKTPTGYIPKYEDLKRLFKEVLGREYSKEEYDEQFKIRVLELMAKISRVEVIYREKVPDTPKILFKLLDEQRKRLEALREAKGDYVLPENL